MWRISDMWRILDFLLYPIEIIGTGVQIFMDIYPHPLELPPVHL